MSSEGILFCIITVEMNFATNKKGFCKCFLCYIRVHGTKHLFFLYWKYYCLGYDRLGNGQRPHNILIWVVQGRNSDLAEPKLTYRGRQ